jgi:hypothetical protein
MAAPDPNQCALSADGSLLDASDIIFYNDPDDTLPLPRSLAPTVEVHPFFAGASSPSRMVAGSRRSLRVARPSTRLTDPDNVETILARKRAAPMSVSTESRRMRPKITDSGDEDIISDDETQDDDANADVENSEVMSSEGTCGEDDDDELQEAYQATKAMGDADREVSLFLTSVSMRLTFIAAGS